MFTFWRFEFNWFRSVRHAVYTRVVFLRANWRQGVVLGVCQAVSVSAQHGTSEDDHLIEAMNMDTEGIDKESDSA